MRIGTILAALGLVVAGATSGAAAHRAQAYATHHIHHLSLTPSGIRTTTSLSYDNAPAGKKFLIVKFHVVNNDDVQEEVGYNDLKVIVYGRTIEQSFASPDNELTHAVLDPGAISDGEISWEVPATSHRCTIRWAPSPFFSDVKYPTYQWIVTY